MTVHVLAFARVREVLGVSESVLDVPSGTRVCDLWAVLCERNAELALLTRSTRTARNGRLAGPAELLEQDDEVALLPPAGGG